MSGSRPYCALEAFIEPTSTDWTGDRVPRQLVTVMMTDGTSGSSRRSARSPPAQARNLAFELLGAPSTPSG